MTEAQKMVAARHPRLADQEMLLRLKQLWQRNGKLSSILIAEDETTPSSAAFQSPFERLHCTYSLIGYPTS
jgi:hypothetical protein